MRGPRPPRPALSGLTDVFAYAQAEGVELRLDATEIQVRRPLANRGGRRAFVSGKKKQNTMKATVIADRRGRTLWTDALRPGRMHDATAARNAGIADCASMTPAVGSGSRPVSRTRLRSRSWNSAVRPLSRQRRKKA